jgi:hypothetical protein
VEVEAVMSKARLRIQKTINYVAANPNSKAKMLPQKSDRTRREKRLDANTQLRLLSLEKVAFLDPLFVQDGSDLIPGAVMEHFLLLLILSRIGRAAQNAQRVYGVPASFLIGKYLVDYGWDDEHSSEEAQQVFLKEAETLSRNFPTELDLLSSPVEYAIALHKRGGLVNSLTGNSHVVYLMDVAERILNYGLLECDYRYGTGTGGLYDIGQDVSQEGVATVLGCSADSARRLYESGEFIGGRKRCAGFSNWPCGHWTVNGHLLRTYVQRVRWEEFEGSLPPVGAPAVKTDARQLVQ